MRISLVVALSCAVAAPAAAQTAEDDPMAPPQELDDAEALRQPFRAARALFDDGRLSEAAIAFGQLYERFPWVGLLYDQAVCLERLGQDAVADRLYREALERATAFPDRLLIEDRIARRGTPELRSVVVVWSKPRMRLRLPGARPLGNGALGRTPWNGMLEGEVTLIFSVTGLPDAQRKVTFPPRDLTTLYYVSVDQPAHGHLDVRSRPSSAQVLVDGRPQGKTPFSDDLALGRHHVAVRHEGFTEDARDVDVTPVEPELELDLVLQPQRHATPGPSRVRKLTAPLKLICGGLLAWGSISVSGNIGDDGAPAAVGTGIMGVAAAAFLTWGVVSLW